MRSLLGYLRGVHQLKQYTRFSFIDEATGLSGGAVAAIVITVLLLLTVAVAGFLFYRKKRKNRFSAESLENPMSLISSKADDTDDESETLT